MNDSLIPVLILALMAISGILLGGSLGKFSVREAVFNSCENHGIYIYKEHRL